VLLNLKNSGRFKTKESMDSSLAIKLSSASCGKTYSQCPHLEMAVTGPPCKMLFEDDAMYSAHGNCSTHSVNIRSLPSLVDAHRKVLEALLVCLLVCKIKRLDKNLTYSDAVSGPKMSVIL
jgi:hypothetical protein